MKRIAIPLVFSLLTAACAHTAPPEDNNVPYPQSDLQSRVNRLEVEVSRLQIELEETKKAFNSHNHTRQAAPKHQTVHVPKPTENPHTAVSDSPQKRAWEQAKKLYQRKQFAAVPRLLAYAENGGDGSTVARDSMYLLLLSHWRMGHCETVINLATRFGTRFSDSTAEASEALWLTGLCQERMQQKDIATETWRKLMHTYPNSAAAKRAAQRLKH